MSKIGIVYITYDGAINSTCGVGVLSQYFIKSFPQVSSAIVASHHVQLSLEVIAVRLNENGHGYSRAIKETTEKIAQNSGGNLNLIENGTNGKENYGRPVNWETVSKEAVKKIVVLSQKYDQLIVYLIDTPFLCAPYFARQANLKNTTFVLVPHSDVFSHFPDGFPLDRLGWEASAFTMVNVFNEVYLGQTSQYLINVLNEHYRIPAGKVISLQTGLLLDDARFQQLTDEEIEHKLSSYHIPVDKKLIFGVARAVPYKGFEDLIQAFAILHKTNPDTHLVFIASPHRNSSSNIPELKRLIELYDITNACTSIYDLDMELPRFMCQWKNTKIVAQLSHREPFGLVPEEVRVWARKVGPVVVASDIGGFKEQIEHGKDGYLVDPHDHKQVAEIFQIILEADNQMIESIRAKGYERCLKQYNYADAVKASLESVLGKI